MPQNAWSAKRERQYEHIKESELEQGGARNVRRRSPRARSTRGERRRVRRRTATARYAGGVKPKTLDHVAFWVTDREPIVDFLTQHVGMHVIDNQDAFTLVGSDARRGKLTLFT